MSKHFPKHCYAWTQLFQKKDGKLRFGIWPYTRTEWYNIYKSGSLNKHSSQMVIRAARRYVFISRSKGKGKPRDELARVQAAMREARFAFVQLGIGAQVHLADNLPGRPLGPRDGEPEAVAAARRAAQERFDKRASTLVTETIVNAVWALDRFERTHFDALEKPPLARRGRPELLPERWLISRLRRAFNAAHAGGPGNKARGFPAFREACARPIGLPHREEKAWQDLERPKRRVNDPENHDLTRAT